MLVPLQIAALTKIKAPADVAILEKIVPEVEKVEKEEKIVIPETWKLTISVSAAVVEAYRAKVGAEDAKVAEAMRQDIVQALDKHAPTLLFEAIHRKLLKLDLNGLQGVLDSIAEPVAAPEPAANP